MQSVKPTDEDQQLLYRQLKHLAALQLRNVAQGQTLTPTVIVNEAYIKLSRTAWRNEADIWNCKALFYTAAAEAMRQIVIDHYRKRSCQKRGGNLARLNVDMDLLPSSSDRYDLLDVNEALEQFALVQPTKAMLVKLRFFAGMTLQECAVALEVSLPTVERHWRYARAWLADWLS